MAFIISFAQKQPARRSVRFGQDVDMSNARCRRLDLWQWPQPCDAALICSIISFYKLRGDNHAAHLLDGIGELVITLFCRWLAVENINGDGLRMNSSEA